MNVSCCGTLHLDCIQHIIIMTQRNIWEAYACPRSGAVSYKGKRQDRYSGKIIAPHIVI